MSAAVNKMVRDNHNTIVMESVILKLAKLEKDADHYYRLADCTGIKKKEKFTILDEQFYF